MDDLMKSLPPERAKLFKIKRNNCLFAQAVRCAFACKPMSGEYLLNHINGLFLAKDSGSGGKAVLGIYIDDDTAASIFNEWRSEIVEALQCNGFKFGEIRIIASPRRCRRERRFLMRKRGSGECSKKCGFLGEKSSKRGTCRRR